MSLVAISNCAHSCTAHLFEHPLCEEQSLVQRIMNVVFHILTLCIPLVIYHIISCSFPRVVDFTPNDATRDVAFEQHLREIISRPAPSVAPFNLFEKDSTLDLKATPQNSLAPTNGSLFNEKKLGKNIMQLIGRFLYPQEQMKCMPVSREFKKFAQADIHWHDYLKRFQLWGGDARLQFLFSNDAMKFPFDENANAYQQIMAYRQLKIDGCVVNIARQMRGGPLAYKNIPILDLLSVPGHIQHPFSDKEPIEGIKVEHMRAPIMRGKDRFNHDFIALCLIDKGRKDPKPTVLVLVSEAERGFHAANDYFKKNQIQFYRYEHSRYLLNIISREPIPIEECPAGFSNQIELYDPIQEEKKNS